jgi:hypothetical protein
MTNRFENGPGGTLYDESKQVTGHVIMGTINRVIEASALLCLQLSAEDTGTSSTAFVKDRQENININVTQKAEEIKNIVGVDNSINTDKQNRSFFKNPWVVGIGTAVISGILLYMIQAIILKETTITKQTDKQPAKSVVDDLFHVSTTSLVRFRFPGHLLFIYNSQLGKTISPISVALFIEVTNKRPSITRIFSYKIRALLTYDEGGEIIVTNDAKGDQKVTYEPSGNTVTKWRELHSVGLLHDQIYYVQNDWKKAQHLGFSHNSFDNIAAEKQLRYGESIKGWVMLELEPDLRGQLPEIREFEFTITNSAGESQVLKVPVGEEGKVHPIISSGSWKFLGGFHDLTKEHYTICPMIDVREIVRKDK